MAVVKGALSKADPSSLRRLRSSRAGAFAPQDDSRLPKCHRERPRTHAAKNRRVGEVRPGRVHARESPRRHGAKQSGESRGAARDLLDVRAGQVERARRGIEPALPLAYVAWFMETVGAICIMLGLFTRVFAIAAVIEFIVIVVVAHAMYGFLWSRPGGGWEYPLLWGLLFLAVALRGGGPYSLDRKIGWEF